MKIIYIDKGRFPTEKANGYQVSKMCEEFSALGAEVELWFPTRKNKIEENIFKYYGIKENFAVRNIGGVDVFKCYKYFKKASFHIQGIALLIALLFKKVDRKALIYTRNSEIAWLFSLRGYKIVYEAHFWPVSKSWLYIFLLKRINKIVCNSKGTNDKFKNNNFNNTMVAPDGVDLEKFDISISQEKARRKLGLPLEKKIILYTGHLYQWKGVDALAQAAEKLSENIVVYFVGGTVEDEKNFKKIYAWLIAEQKIIVIGHKPHGLIPIWLKAADILALPNSQKEKISKFYTSPLKLFEYMASKRPIIASDMPSIREVLNDNNCLFIQPDNASDLANKINYILNNKELTNKITSQAFSDVIQYSWDKRARQILDFINN